MRRVRREESACGSPALGILAHRPCRGADLGLAQVLTVLFAAVACTASTSCTTLRFWQHYATELSDDAYGTYNYNWGYYLESLRLLCESGTGHPFEP
jgi:hypothetical protein